MKGHIVFLSSAHPPEDKRVFAKEAITLAAAGWRVTHLCPWPGSGPAAYDKDGVRIATYRRGKRIVQRAFGVLALARRGLSERPDVLHCNEVDSWVSGLLAKLWSRGKVRVVFDVHEHYPSTFAESRFPPALRPFVAATLRLLFRALTPFTDRIVFAKRTVAPDYPGAGAKGVLVQNFAPAASPSPSPPVLPPLSPASLAFPSPAWAGQGRGEGGGPHSVHPGPGASRAERPPSPNPLPPRLGGEGSKGSEGARAGVAEEGRTLTLIHVGLISRLRGWPQLLAAMAQLPTPARLHVIGTFNDGSEADFQAEVARLGLAEQVQHHSWMPFDAMMTACRAADIGLVLFQPGTQNHVFASPHKLFDYWLAGLPVIAPDFAVEVRAFMEDAQGGMLVDPSDPAAIARATAALADPALRRTLGQAGRAAVLARYNWEAEAAKLITMYRTLLPA
jgi:glycosyltransferase involved in cell wall biosynthesis